MKFKLYISLFNFSCPFAITSLICYEIAILYKTMAKSMRNGKFRPTQLRNRLIDFDKIRMLELSP